MVKISSSPNVRGINDLSDSIEYKSKLIGRKGRSYAALSVSRVKGISIGITLAFVLIILIPYIAKVCGF